MNDEKVKPGDVLLTSGDDRIFPKGLLIGTVTDAKPALPFQLIHVQPAARLDRLEDVLVLLSQQELEPKKTGEASFPLIPERSAEPTASATRSLRRASALRPSRNRRPRTAPLRPAAPRPLPPKPGATAPKPSAAPRLQNPPAAAKPHAAARQ